MHEFKKTIDFINQRVSIYAMPKDAKVSLKQVTLRIGGLTVTIPALAAATFHGNGHQEVVQDALVDGAYFTPNYLFNAPHAKKFTSLTEFKEFLGFQRVFNNQDKQTTLDVIEDRVDMNQLDLVLVLNTGHGDITITIPAVHVVKQEDTEPNRAAGIEKERLYPNRHSAKKALDMFTNGDIITFVVPEGIIKEALSSLNRCGCKNIHVVKKDNYALVAFPYRKEALPSHNALEAFYFFDVRLVMPKRLWLEFSNSERATQC